MNALAILAALLLQPADKAPPVVDPGPYVGPGAAPSDAIVLFDGTSLDGWTTIDGKPAAWACEGTKGGSMTIEPGKGAIVSKRAFGDAQIHVEFMEPPVTATSGVGQDRGNSGVYIQGRYEVQVLDSYKSETYPNGQCGAIYGQHVPLVNACRPPGEWQTYDIVFHAARNNGQGERLANPRVTVLHNGVLIQDNVEITGATGAAEMKDSAVPGPIYLQDHGHRVQYRNVWVRER